MANPRAAANSPMTPDQMLNINFAQRNAVLNQALDQELNILTQTYTLPNQGAPGQTINIPLRNVGLVKKFTVLVRANIHSLAAETQTLQPLGPANFFSQVMLTDLQNQMRINTTGWHLHFIASMKAGAAFAAAFANDSPVQFGNNFNVIKAPATLTSTTPQQLYMAYEIPVCYSDLDLRGAIYANVVNATWNLALTVNPQMFVGSSADGVGAVYKSATGALGVMDSWTIEVYQHFLDQLPVDANNQIIIPMMDVSVMYKLENTVQGGLVVNQEGAVPFANFRKFLSTTVIYDNNGVLNAGSDVNYFGMQTANTVNLFKRSPMKIALDTRKMIGDDMPPGCYFFDHRKRPIETSQFGNVQLTYNLSNVGSSQSVLLIGYEYMTEMAIITQAGSIQN